MTQYTNKEQIEHIINDMIQYIPILQVSNAQFIPILQVSNAQIEHIGMSVEVLQKSVS